MPGATFHFKPTMPPPALAGIAAATRRIAFDAASEERTGQLLMTLAATKPGGHFLELGTGTGVSAAWLLAGMDQASRLHSVDTDADVQAVAKRALAGDPRITFHLCDGATFIAEAAPGSFDLIFADAWPGKFSDLESALVLLKPGGIYLVDDLLPQANWPANHQSRVDEFTARLEAMEGLAITRLDWASGLILAVRTGTIDKAGKG